MILFRRYRYSTARLREIVHLHHRIFVIIVAGAAAVPVADLFRSVISGVEAALGPAESEGDLAVVHDLLRLVGVDVGGGASFGEDVKRPRLSVLRCGQDRVGGFVPHDGEADGMRTLGAFAEIVRVEHSAT